MALEDEEDKNQKQKQDTIKTSKPFRQFGSTLPTEVIVEILLRLPVLSLLRCKSVCKLWRSLISDPHFVKSHLTSSTTNNHHHRLLFRTSPGINFVTCRLCDVLDDNLSCIDDEEDRNQKQKPERIKTSKSFQQPVSTLPTEVIVEILSRLPVDSLLLCKSVCKLWRSLISDPRLAHHHRLLFRTRPGINIETCHLYDVLYDNLISTDALEVDYLLIKACTTARLVGSCNGLLCVAIKGDVLFIWNPSTRKSITLPHNGYMKRFERPVAYGFGYEKCADDYKVVEISYLYKGIGEYETFVNIHSLKNGNWKKIGAFPNGVPLHHFGKFANGALHWLIGKAFRSSSLQTIISLDLATENFGEVSQPVYDEGDKYLTLGTLREWLCMICYYPQICLDVWVMKVYGVKDSWTKLVTFPYLAYLGRDIYRVPFWIINDGKVLLQLRSKLIVYDSKDSSIIEIQDIDECIEACTYVESLVSPTGCQESR